MRKKGIVVAVAIVVAWTGSLWMAFWAGFSCHLSLAVIGDRLNDKARLIEDEALLRKMEDGRVEYVRRSLSESVMLGKERIDIDNQMPSFGLVGIALEGITSPRESILLIRAVHATEARFKMPPEK